MASSPRALAAAAVKAHRRARQNLLQGLAGVIIDDGPIIMDPVESLKVWDDIQVAIGGSGGSAGNGAAVDVNNYGAITTLGIQSTAIYAQSVGGGGGRGGASTGGSFAIASIGGKADPEGMPARLPS